MESNHPMNEYKPLYRRSRYLYGINRQFVKTHLVNLY